MDSERLRDLPKDTQLGGMSDCGVKWAITTQQDDSWRLCSMPGHELRGSEATKGGKIYRVHLYSELEREKSGLWWATLAIGQVVG